MSTAMQRFETLQDEEDGEERERENERKDQNEKLKCGIDFETFRTKLISIE